MRYQNIQWVGPSFAFCGTAGTATLRFHLHPLQHALRGLNDISHASKISARSTFLLYRKITLQDSPQHPKVTPIFSPHAMPILSRSGFFSSVLVANSDGTLAFFKLQSLQSNSFSQLAPWNLIPKDLIFHAIGSGSIIFLVWKNFRGVMTWRIPWIPYTSTFQFYHLRIFSFQWLVCIFICSTGQQKVGGRVLIPPSSQVRGEYIIPWKVEHCH